MSPSSHWIPSAFTPGATDGAADGGISTASPATSSSSPRQLPESPPTTYAYLSSLSFCVPIHPNDPRPTEFSSTPNGATQINDHERDGTGGGGLVRQRQTSNQRRPNAAHSLVQQQQSQHHHLHHQHPHSKLVKHKRRYCGVPGCKSIVKSQGVCQRHGAKPRKCRIETCTKQAQGNFGGMCKVHYKAQSRSAASAAAAATAGIGAAPDGGQAPTTSTESSSIEDGGSERDVPVSSTGALHDEAVTCSSVRFLDPHSSSSSDSADPPPPRPAMPSVYDSVLPASLEWRLGGPKRRGDNEDCSNSDMPFVEYLIRNGAHLSGGWHRRQERHARGYPPLSDAGDGTAGPPGPVEWDDWERELIWTELLLLTGADATSDDRPAAAMDLLAHAWGCRPGFHMEFISEWIGERRTVAPLERRAESHDDVYNECENDATISVGGDDLADVDDMVDDGEDADCVDDDDENVAMTHASGGATPVIGADAWDDACYTAHSYNEALASDLLLEHLSSSSPQHTPTAIVDGILRMMDRQGEDHGGEDEDDDEDRVTDDASSSSSREDADLAQVGNE